MKTRNLVVAASLLLLTGAGCLGGSSTKTATGGVWTTANGGKAWTAMNVLPTASGVSSIGSVDILSLTRDPSDAKVLYAGTKTSGLLYSLDGGLSWQRPPEDAAFATIRSGSVIAVAVDPKDPCTIYALKTDRLLKTSNCGRSFEDSYVETRTDEKLTALALDWYNSKNVWVGNTAGDILHSTDAGANWSASQRVKDDVSAIEISNADSRVVLVGTARNSIYRTSDSGATWKSLEDDFRSLSQADRVHGFAQSADGKTAVLNSDYGLFTSADNGATWKPLSLVTAHGEVRIYAVGVSPKDGNTIVYGTDSTFYRSTSGGTSWNTEELPTARAASAILFSPEDSASLMLGVQALEK
jgi:photosystem II stability/assembly factor-like uncharacterized protein